MCDEERKIKVRKFKPQGGKLAVWQDFHLREARLEVTRGGGVLLDEEPTLEESVLLHAMNASFRGKAYCNICSSSKQDAKACVRFTGQTTTLMNHLKTEHPTSPENEPKQIVLNKDLERTMRFLARQQQVGRCY